MRISSDKWTGKEVDKVENSYGKRTGLIHHSEKKKDNSR